MDIQDKIDKYLLGRMTAEEKAQFEEEANSNSSVKERLEFCRNVQKAVNSREHKIRELRKMKMMYEERNVSSAQECSEQRARSVVSSGQTGSGKSYLRRILIYTSGIAAVLLVGFFVAPYLYQAPEKEVDVSEPAVRGESLTFKGKPQTTAEERVKRYISAAEKGNVDAQYKLALCYYKGEGIAQSYSNAIEWFRKAAENGNADAQYSLGMCYFEGHACCDTMSNAEAVAWLQKAAENGVPEAQYVIGVFYYNGENLPKSEEKAKEWFRKAAELGDKDAVKALESLQ